MRFLIPTGLVMALWVVSVSATASSPAELHLWKQDPYFHGPCGHCADFYAIRTHDNPADLTLFELYNQSGYYYIDLNGPAGTTVTLYGQRKHSPDRGFLIVRKNDDAPIAVADLESFPPNRWVEVAAENSSSGAYSVWYQPYGGFKNSVESVRWGQWWTELPPAPGKP
ncbi:MAG: hypothetical protein O6857_00375 [Nitrospinae bacterium]|nr:hypothetical protein [Nitrospinota bacterium]